MKKLISVVVPCYNEEKNVEEVYDKVKAIFAKRQGYDYEHIFIDNASTDATVETLKRLAKKDKNVKVIVNARNFGHIRSPYHGLLQANGDAVVLMAADLQDPPELIDEFIGKWETGYKVVVGVKTRSRENQLVFHARKAYYRMLRALSDVDLIENYTGFGLYDKRVIEVLRDLDDPYPYLRGIICEIGFERAIIEFTQPMRKEGRTKNNLYTLYDMAMVGITNHTKVPLRLAILIGFGLAFASIVMAAVYLAYKLVFWNSFSVGVAPLVIGLFFFSSVQLMFLGLVGEYIGMIYTHVQKRPLVVEKERVNF